MKKIKFQKRIMKNNKNHIIPLENNENLETKNNDSMRESIQS